MIRSPRIFFDKVKPYLHPEATEFYHKVSQSIDYLYSIQKDINDPESRFTYCLGGKSYNVYAFEHYKDYKTWVEDTSEIYKKVSNYDQLLDTNILFLKGLMPMTFYHLSPIYDMNTQKLQKITKKFKFFTMDGQSNQCTDSEKQRPYLSGIIKTDQLYPIIHQLKKQSGYYFSYYIPSTEESEDNILFDKLKFIDWLNLRREMGYDDEPEDDDPEFKTLFNVTLDYNEKSEKFDLPISNISLEPAKIGWDDFYELSTHKLSEKVINDIESTCASLEIYGTEYCKGNIEDLLLSLK
jgi:hypothetical protein